MHPKERKEHQIDTNEHSNRELQHEINEIKENDTDMAVELAALKAVVAAWTLGSFCFAGLLTWIIVRGDSNKERTKKVRRT